MKRIIKLTESDLTRIVRRVIMEQETQSVVDLSKLGLGQYSQDGANHIYTSPKGNTAEFRLYKILGGQGATDVGMFITFPNGGNRVQNLFKEIKGIDPKAEMSGMSSYSKGSGGVTISAKINSSKLTDVVNKIKRNF